MSAADCLLNVIWSCSVVIYPRTVIGPCKQYRFFGIRYLCFNSENMELLLAWLQLCHAMHTQL